MSDLDRLLALAVVLGAGPDLSVTIQRYCPLCDGRLGKDAEECSCGWSTKTNDGNKDGKHG